MSIGWGPTLLAYGLQRLALGCFSSRTALNREDMSSSSVVDSEPLPPSQKLGSIRRM